jgi:hypothetical protein
MGSARPGGAVNGGATGKSAERGVSPDGLLRCYTSRVENSHSVPSVETLEKYARASEIPLYRLFTDEKDVKIPKLPRSNDGKEWGKKKEDSAELRAFAKALSRLDDQKRKLILVMAQKMAGRIKS